MEIKRHYFKWNINEIIQLQREYELLELSIQEIAKLHCRSVRAILCKLQQEDFIKHWEDTKGYEEYMNSDDVWMSITNAILNNYVVTSACFIEKKGLIAGHGYIV